MILGWRERAGFIAMGELPTDNHVKVLRAVHESLNGIEAISQKQFGLQCVTNGWLEHTPSTAETMVALLTCGYSRSRGASSSKAEQTRFGQAH